MGGKTRQSRTQITFLISVHPCMDKKAMNKVR